MQRTKKILILALMVFFINAPVHADEIAELKKMLLDMREDYEQRIDMLEAKIENMENKQVVAGEHQLAQMKEDIQEEMKADSWQTQYVGRDHHAAVGKGGFLATSPQGHTQVSVGGYMDHEFENFENTKSTFDQHRWIINIGAQIGERLRFFSEYEIEHGGPDASGGGEAKVEQAYVDFLIDEAINMRLGAVLVPFGSTNIYHDSDLRDLTSRPLLARDIIPTTWTESGAGFFGEFEPVIGDYEDLLINYEVYVMNGLDDGFSDTGLGGAKGSLKSDNNNAKSVAGRIVFSPAIGHHVGLSGYVGKYNTFDDMITGKGVDWLSTWGPFEFVGEYAYFDVEVPDFAATGITDVAESFEGLRAQVNYHFWPEFLSDTFLGRSFDDPTFTLSGRYGWAKIDDDADAGTGDNKEERYTLGLNYRPVESWVFKVEYQWNETDNEALERGDNDGWFTSVAMGF